MADNSDSGSEGSDIDAGSEDDEVLNGLGLGSAVLQEVQQGADDNLDGFHSIWIDQNWPQGFDPRHARPFSGNPGHSDQHPEEAQLCITSTWFGMMRSGHIW